MVNDPVGDLIIQLKNAGMAGKPLVSLPYSKLKFAVATALEKNGFIKSVTKRGKKTRKVLEVELLYINDGKARIQGVSRVSKPGRRVYQGVRSIFRVRGGRGAFILSTPKGILTGEEAQKEHVGGEMLFKIW